MYFLVSQSTCSEPALGKMLYVVKNILGIIQIISPILLIVMLSIHLTNIMRNPDDKKALPKIKNAAIALIVIFLIPTIVNAVMYMLGDNLTISDCWNNASAGNNTPSYVDPNEGKRQHIGTDPSEYENGKKQQSAANTESGSNSTSNNSRGTNSSTTGTS